mgnify:FL=1
MHKSGFVNIIGNPNVGKSTLMNALVGEKLSIITSKAQTTRHRILGIVNGDDFQIVFSDTPGILKPCYKLQESMMNFVRGALSDADVLLYVTDTVERDDERAAEIIDRIRQSGVPTLVVVNKIDLTTQEALEALDPKQLFGGVIDLSNDLMLASLLGAVLIGLGVGLVLRNQATTGGTDIIAMYLQKFAKMKFSTGILLADSCVVLSGLLVIGFGVGSGADREAVEGGSWLLSFYSLITIYVSSRVLAYVIDGASYDKLLFIISENHHAELRDFIIEDMDRSGTYIKGKGMYTDQDREMIFVVVSRKEVHLVQNKVREIDPKAFMVVTDAYETFGEGFKQFPDKDTIQAVG